MIGSRSVVVRSLARFLFCFLVCFCSSFFSSFADGLIVIEGDFFFLLLSLFF